MTLSPEAVGYWYFRLNGFLTIQNFVVHPDDAGNQNTDADIIGVRFPYRAELLRNPMQDDDVFTSVEDKPFVVFVETKKGQCNINTTLRDPAQQNDPQDHALAPLAHNVRTLSCQQGLEPEERRQQLF